MKSDTKQQSILQQSINHHLGAGEYQVLQPLKRGGDGYVFKAKISKSNKLIAIKNLPKTKIDYQITAQTSQKKHNHCANLIKKAKNQIKIHQSLKSQFFVKLFRWFQDNDNFYLMLQYYPKGDLTEYMKQFTSGLPLETVRNIGGQVAKGISVLHQQGVIHRDIKPNNILLGNQLSIKICDFSCATKFQPGQKVNGAMGTIKYMAPQMIRRTYDEKVDVWSFGCLLYYLAVGEAPFKIQNGQIKDIKRKINEQLDKLKYPSDFPSSFKNLLMKIFSVDPKNRPNIKQVINHPFIMNKDLQILEENDDVQYGKQLKKDSRISQSCQHINNLKPQMKKDNMKKLILQKTQKSEHKMMTQKSIQNLDPNRLRYSCEMQKQIKKNIFSQDLLKKKMIYDRQQIKQYLTNDLNSAQQLTPLNCEGVYLETLQPNNQKIVINQNGLQKKFMKTGKVFRISPTGNTIQIFCEGDSRVKMYQLKSLPVKYHKLYNDLKQIVQGIKKGKLKGTNSRKMLQKQNTPYYKILETERRNTSTKVNKQQIINRVSDNQGPTIKFSMDFQIETLSILIKYKIVKGSPEKSKYEVQIKDNQSLKTIQAIIGKQIHVINQQKILKIVQLYLQPHNKLKFEQQKSRLIQSIKIFKHMAQAQIAVSKITNHEQVIRA